MDSKQVRYFLNLAETLNFTDAARLSGISQPSLTRSIKNLEKELGGTLIYRDGKESRLSPLGRSVQIEFMHLERLFQNIQSLSQTSAVDRVPEIKIGFLPTHPVKLLTQFVHYAQTQIRGLKIHLEPWIDSEGLEALFGGRFDLLFANLPLRDAKLSVCPLFTEVLHVGMSKQHELAAYTQVPAFKLSAFAYADRVHCEFRSEVLEQLMDQDVLMHPVLSTDREDVLQSFVASGNALCMLPEFSVLHPDLITRPVKGLDIQRRVALVSPSRSGLSQDTQHLMMLAQHFQWPNTSQLSRG